MLKACTTCSLEMSLHSMTHITAALISRMVTPPLHLNLSNEKLCVCQPHCLLQSCLINFLFVVGIYFFMNVVTIITPVFSEEAHVDYSKRLADGSLSKERPASSDTPTGGYSPIFFVASRGHHSEIGGITPGSMPPFSRNVLEEGILIDNFLLVDRGMFRVQETITLFTDHKYPR